MAIAFFCERDQVKAVFRASENCVYRVFDEKWENVVPAREAEAFGTEEGQAALLLEFALGVRKAECRVFPLSRLEWRTLSW